MERREARPITIIVLAAGLSTRFGRNKLLEPIGFGTMIERVVSETLRSRADKTVVVLGHDADKIREALKGLKCHFVVNEEFEKGQSFSVRKGLSAVEEAAQALMILPGDVAGVNHQMIDAVIAEYMETGAPIVTAGHHGISGHPILFDRSLLGELKQIDEESRGIKKVVAKHRSERRLVESSPLTLLDVDKQDDLERLAQVSPGLVPRPKGP